MVLKFLFNFGRFFAPHDTDGLDEGKTGKDNVQHRDRLHQSNLFHNDDYIIKFFSFLSNCQHITKM